jgi:asparagine synthase (glutamine-hydrolysing)
MCGIAGVWTPPGLPLPQDAEAILARMHATIRHRGPDAEGVWRDEQVGLAHRRLAIIDLSPAGVQPMHDAESAATIAYNGEIYNYREPAPAFAPRPTPRSSWRATSAGATRR